MEDAFKFVAFMFATVTAAGTALVLVIKLASVVL